MLNFRSSSRLIWSPFRCKVSTFFRGLQGHASFEPVFGQGSTFNTGAAGLADVKRPRAVGLSEHVKTPCRSSRHVHSPLFHPVLDVGTPYHGKTPLRRVLAVHFVAMPLLQLTSGALIALRFVPDIAPLALRARQDSLQVFESLALLLRWGRDDRQGQSLVTRTVGTVAAPRLRLFPAFLHYSQSYQFDR